MSKGTGWYQTIQQKPQYLAIFVALLVIIWMASGALNAQEAPVNNKQKEIPIPSVQITKLETQGVQRSLTLYGRTEPDRVATLRSETKGQVTDVLVQEGEFVKKGQVLIKLALNDIDQQIAHANAVITQQQINYDGVKKLNLKGYQGKSRLAEANAALVSAKTRLVQLELEKSRTTIRAPFSGWLNQRHVEQGDLLRVGDNIAQLVDLDPIIVQADVTENNISQISVGINASLKIAGTENASGDVRYVASQSHKGTNTFAIEIAVPNENGKVKAGISTEVEIPFETVQAIKLSPALLALDEKGNIGVKTVENETVIFTPINMVKSEPDGIWLSGFSGEVDVITLGQGFVRAGDKVKPSYLSSNLEGE